MTDAPASGAPAPGGRLSLPRRASLAAAVMLLLAVPLVLLAGPATYRLHLLPLDAAMWGLSKLAFWLAAGAALASVAVIVIHGRHPPHRGVIAGVVVLTFALLALGRIYLMPNERSDLPPVWDAQTDWAHPIAFSPATLAERAAAGAPQVRNDVVIDKGLWAGRTIEQAQRGYYSADKAEYYPLNALKVKQSPADTRAAVMRAVRDQGWTPKPASADGLIEAVHVSRWYGLVSDIAIRVEPEGSGARVDVRSTSRTPAADMGANANRVKDVLDALRLSLRPDGERTPGPLE